MTSDMQTVVLRCLDDSSADANLAAQRLSEFIADESVRIPGSPPALSLRKDRSDTQDLGTTLVLVFGTPFAIAIAKGIAAYIAAAGSRIVIETPAGTVIASGDGVKNLDVAKTTAALQRGPTAPAKPPELAGKEPPPAKALPPAAAKVRSRAAGKATSARKTAKK